MNAFHKVAHMPFEAFLEITEHHNNQEPIYSLEAYVVYEAKNMAMITDVTGKDLSGFLFTKNEVK